MKKRIAAVLAAALILGVGVGTSYAYLTGKDDVENTFQASKTDIKIEENFTPVPELTPGTVITKAPRVISQSSTPCYVRMMVQFSDDEAQKFCQPLVINSGWRQKGDGYYYWDKALSPGEATGTLFDSVTIRPETAKEDMESFDILVYAEAVQSRGMSAEEAWEAMS